MASSRKSAGQSRAYAQWVSAAAALTACAACNGITAADAMSEDAAIPVADAWDVAVADDAETGPLGNGGTGAEGGAEGGVADASLADVDQVDSSDAADDSSDAQDGDGGVPGDANQCPAGFSDCNSAASDGCEVDTAWDRNNCGGCGNACWIAGCWASACLPLFDAVTDPGDDPTDPALDDAFFYWFDGYENLKKRSKSWGPVINLGSVGSNVLQGGPHDLETDGQNVYFMHADQVRTVSVQGGQATNVATASNTPLVRVDGAYVYYAYDQTIRRAAVAGGQPEVLVTGATVFAVQGGLLFWYDASGARIARQSSGTSSATTVTSVPNEVTEIIVAATYLVWVERVESAPNPLEYRLSVAPTTGGPSVVLRSAASSIWGVADNETHLFWWEGQTSKALWTMPVAGGPARGLYFGLVGNLSRLVVDDDNFYWTESWSTGGGAILRGDNPW